MSRNGTGPKSDKTTVKKSDTTSANAIAASNSTSTSALHTHANPASSNGFSRRDFLKTGTFSGLFIGAGGVIGCSNTQGVRDRNYEGTAKNVIFMVSDGMSTGTLTMADSMLRRRDGRPSNWIRLYEEKKVVRGLMDMASANSIVTDSAAAASSWGCGVRIVNGAVNMGPDGEEFPPLLPIFRDAGKATGLVTTTRITHATPAGFSVHSPERGLEDEIAVKQIAGNFDVLLGGGNTHLDPAIRPDGLDLYARASDAGYRIFRSKNEMSGWNGDEKILGIFSDSHVPYTLDHINIPEHQNNVPTLAEMTRTAIRRLSANPNGFIMQIEGGRVDHAAHNNDLGGLIYDQIAFDEAIGAVLEFTEGRNDTLVIITTDHGNANPGLNATGAYYNDSNTNFDKIQNFRYSNDWILSGLNRNSGNVLIRDRFEEATRLQMSQAHAETLRQALRGEFRATYSMMSSASVVLGQIIAEHTAVNWVGTAHTSDYVELASYGPGSSAIGPFTINTDLFSLVNRAAGVRIPESSSYRI